jgi:hypothetical protein
VFVSAVAANERLHEEESPARRGLPGSGGDDVIVLTLAAAPDCRPQQTRR